MLLSEESNSIFVALAQMLQIPGIHGKVVMTVLLVEIMVLQSVDREEQSEAASSMLDVGGRRGQDRTH